MATPEAGRAFGPYEAVSIIGKGGMGEVWRARDPRLGRDVAIKVSAQQFTDRFEREARAIAALNHPNICTLHDVGPNYLVMELVEGPTLAERIAEGPIPVEETLRIAKQIGDALEAAQEKGITLSANAKYLPASANGELVYHSGAGRTTRLTWFDPDGNPLGTVAPPRVYADMNLSADEKRVVADRADLAGPRTCRTVISG
jgi:hypothetical protein